jgi:hypothetical protein
MQLSSLTHHNIILQDALFQTILTFQAHGSCSVFETSLIKQDGWSSLIQPKNKSFFCFDEDQVHTMAAPHLE